MNAKAILSLGLALLSCLSQGKTIFVDQKIRVPGYRDIQTALDAAEYGDTILVREGFYPGPVVVDLRSTGSGYLTIRNYMEDLVVIDGNNPASGPLVSIQCDRVRLEGLHIAHSSTFGIISRNRSDIVIKDCEVSYSNDGGIVFVDGSRIEVSGCHVHHNNFRGLEAAHEGISMHNVNMFEIHGCKVHDNREEGIDAKYGSKLGRIHHNLVYRNNGPNIYIDKANQIDVYGNTVHSAVSKAGISLNIESAWHTPGLAWTMMHVNVYNNLIYGNSGGIGFWLEPGNGEEKQARWDYITIMNNTIIDNCRPGGERGGGIYVLNPGTENFGDHILVRNNIFCGNSNEIARSIWDRYASGVLKKFTVDHNLFILGESSDAFGDDSVLTRDPGFSDATNTDYSLRSGSPAIDRGTGNGIPETDFSQRSRNQGKYPDIGAFEFTPVTREQPVQVPAGPIVLDSHQQLARDIFRELIEINTTAAHGSTKAAEAMADRLLSSGFRAADVKVTGPDALHKNLVVRYQGKGKFRPILFICHLDVVEALPGDWSTDPFTFVEKDGYYYGRGTTDIKNECADLIATLMRLKKEGFIPDRDIIVALTADEEGGPANGVNWLLANNRDLIDAEFCINPDGGGGDMLDGKHVSLAVQTSEKIYASFDLEAKNKGGHSSLPIRDNAIYRLSAGLTRLAAYDFPVRLNETTEKLLADNSTLAPGPLGSAMMAILRDHRDTAAANRIASTSAYYNAMMRTTCVATLLQAGHAENALPQSARATVNCRMLPDDNTENVLKTLKQVISDTGITVTCTYASFLAPLSPLREDIMTSVTKVAGSLWPGVRVTPVMATGATDGKYLRRAGIPVYGISGMFGDSNDIRAHGRDERTGIREFHEGVEFMYRFMKTISVKN